MNWVIEVDGTVVLSNLDHKTASRIYAALCDSPAMAGGQVGLHREGS